MRSIGAVVLSSTILLVGFVAASMQAGIVEPTLSGGDANSSFDAATAVFEGLGGTLAVAVPIAAGAAFLLAAVGLAVVASRGGR